eukprot:TRINITY_DN5278_c0_g1_i1.p1 TRINITY_DN5278_c0_g1~~TRINITY_DN5278_c0_g1_i1.p1  ORF type:complete len:375 (+),score=43.23 TRINITY_DN5278_c0_g1_i1:132-1256(+)
MASTSFTDKFAEQETHIHQDDCIYCGLKIIFTNYQFSEEAVLPPSALRETLSALYADQGRFKIGEIDDAAETLDAILYRLHHNISTSKDDDNCNPRCISHKVFGITTKERTVCKKCRSTGNLKQSNSFLHLVYVQELLDFHLSTPSTSFPLLLNHMQHTSQNYSCVNTKCTELCGQQKILCGPPEVFSISLVWHSEQPSVDIITTILRLISMKLKLDQIFDKVVDSKEETYTLRGMVCYYGKHYDAFFFNLEQRKWIVFDDATVKEVGSTFDDVIEKCKRGHLQPSILFYVRNDVSYQSPTDLPKYNHYITPSNSNQITNVDVKNPGLTVDMRNKIVGLLKMVNDAVKSLSIPVFIDLFIMIYLLGLKKWDRLF